MLIRYPGSKDKHLKFLKPYLENVSGNIIEPFSGTASVTFFLLENNDINSYHINDVDRGLFCLWLTIKNNPDELIEKILNYKPNVKDFYEFKKEKTGSDHTEEAFRKLVLHQVSFSGLGVKAGGPLGGKNQLSKYSVSSRWSPTRLKNNIIKCSQLLNKVEGTITNKSWVDILNESIGKEVFLYLDPPYFVKGKELYLYGSLDHKLLSETLKKFDNWVLSYDDSPEIREMYSWANIERLDVTSHLHHKTVGDLVIRKN